MNASNVSLFEHVGKYGGIGGIALGVFLLVALQLIKSMKYHSGTFSLQLCKVLAILAWSLCLAGILAWVWVSKEPIHIESHGGVVAGKDIKDTVITITPQAQPDTIGSGSLDGKPQKRYGIVTEKGIAAGGTVKDSMITINGKTQAK